MLEEIKESTEVAKSFIDWFDDEWNRNKGVVDNLIEHNKKLVVGNLFLIELADKLQQENERYKKALITIDNDSVVWNEFIADVLKGPL